MDPEGSGAQDHDDEAILEIATVPITSGKADTAAYATLISPGRIIPRRPWTAPGLTSAILARAGPVDVEPARRLNRRIIVGHNAGVDWRLLHRHYPLITPAEVIDTLKLARHLNPTARNSLAALIGQFGLGPEAGRLAAGSQPHRALWDATAAALLLPALIARTWPQIPTLADLLAVAAISTSSHLRAWPPGQGVLFDAEP